MLGCPVSDVDLVHLSPFRNEIDVIGLEGTSITDDGLGQFVEFPKLDNIDLTSTSTTDRGLLHLARIKTLKYVHLENSHVTSKGIAALQNALPECEIVWH